MTSSIVPAAQRCNPELGAPSQVLLLRGSWDLATRVALKGSFKGSRRATIKGSMWVLRVFRSWDLVTRVISRVTLLLTTYNPNSGTYNLTYKVPCPPKSARLQGS